MRGREIRTLSGFGKEQLGEPNLLICIPLRLSRDAGMDTSSKAATDAGPGCFAGSLPE
jgi:hypothetical protein